MSSSVTLSFKGSCKISHTLILSVIRGFAQLCGPIKYQLWKIFWIKRQQKGTFLTLMSLQETHSDGDSRQPMDHPFITSAYELGGWAKKIVIFADVQYCIDADILRGWVGGSKKVQKFVCVIQDGPLVCLHFHLTRDIRSLLTSSAPELVVGELGGPDGLVGPVGSVGLGGLDEPSCCFKCFRILRVHQNNM